MPLINKRTHSLAREGPAPRAEGGGLVFFWHRKAWVRQLSVAASETGSTHWGGGCCGSRVISRASVAWQKACWDDQRASCSVGRRKEKILPERRLLLLSLAPVPGEVCVWKWQFSIMAHCLHPINLLLGAQAQARFSKEVLGRQQMGHGPNRKRAGGTPQAR